VIAEAELRRLAAAWAVDPMIADLDYVLGCFLSQWYQNRTAQSLRFKGGTCLRKTYSGDYRFSEDLDFTAEKRISIEDLRALLERTIQQMQDVFGLNLSERTPRIEIINDEFGEESYQVQLLDCQYSIIHSDIKRTTLRLPATQPPALTTSSSRPSRRKPFLGLGCIKFIFCCLVR